MDPGPSSSSHDESEPISMDPGPSSSSHDESEPTLSFIQGWKGSDQACYEGYIYSKNRIRPNGDIYWQCRDRKIYTPSCTGRLYTKSKESVIRQTAHNHQPSHTEVLKSAVISSIKYNVTAATPGDVVRDALASAPDDVKAVLPATYLLKKQMRINCKKNQAAQSSSATTADIVIPRRIQERLCRQHATTTEDE